MRSLTFYKIDKVYTYLSPDIEYLHGRHLSYGIVALICTVTIVLGLPLLLTLEPFLNCKLLTLTITGSVSRLLQRQVSLLCWLSYDLSTTNYHSHCQFIQ